MTTTIYQDSDSIAPELVHAYEPETDVATTFHETISGRVIATLRPALPRSGTLNLVFYTEEAAWAAEDFHRRLAFFQLDDTDSPHINMTYGVNGRMRVTLDDDSGAAWILEVPFREIT